jgi:hypothetical protein
MEVLYNYFLGSSCHGVEGGTTQCCPEYYSASGGEGGGLDTTRTSFCYSAAKVMVVNFDFYTVQRNRLRIYCDAVLKLDTGCVTGSGAPTYTIPANTAAVRFLLEPASICGDPNPGDLWSFLQYCQ